MGSGETAAVAALAALGAALDGLVGAVGSGGLEGLDDAGLVEVEWYQRGPLPGEPDATRLYVVARAAGG